MNPNEIERFETARRQADELAAIKLFASFLVIIIGAIIVIPLIIFLAGCQPRPPMPSPLPAKSMPAPRYMAFVAPKQPRVIALWTNSDGCIGWTNTVLHRFTVSCPESRPPQTNDLMLAADAFRAVTNPVSYWSLQHSDNLVGWSILGSNIQLTLGKMATYHTGRTNPSGYDRLVLMK